MKKKKTPTSIRIPEEKVATLKRRVKHGDNYRYIAKKLRISPSTAYGIVTGRTWRYVEPYGRVLDQVKPRISLKTVDAIRKHHEKTGVSDQELADKFGCTRVTAFRIRSKDAPSHRLKWTDEQKKKIRKAARTRSVGFIAKKLKVSNQAINHVLDSAE